MENENRPHTEIPLHTVTKVPVERLVLDRLNPRLFPTSAEADEVEIIARLYRSEDLSELLQSIAANGYLEIEPLIVLEENENLTVLEGNRRLAAIRLFEKRDLARQILQRMRLKITIPGFPAKFHSTIRKVSVYRVDSREEARPFIGFKHINGAAKWESYAKAKFAADWYRKEGTSLSAIATKIGDRHDTIKRMVNAIYVLEQAEDAEVFHLSDRSNPRFSFSHLYSALSRASYMRFLGLEEAWSRYDPEENPVAQEKLGNLGEVLKWLYGSQDENIDPVIQSQNPDIRRLGEVLESPEGLQILRTTHSLGEALLSTGPASQRFSDSLVQARREVREAFNNLRGFDGQDEVLLGFAEDISVTAQAIVTHMRKEVEKIKAEEG